MDFLGVFPCGSAGKECTCNVWDLGSISGLGRCPREGKGYPLPYSGLENFMDSHKESDMTEWLSFSLSLHGFEGRKTAEGECPSYHVIQSTCLIPGNVDLDHLAEVVFVSLFHCQVTLFLPLQIVFFFFGMKSLYLAHSSGIGSYTPPPWEPNYLCQLSEILLHGKLVYCLTCIQSFIYISMDSQIFILYFGV